jgi:hypothetical protein
VSNSECILGSSTSPAGLCGLNFRTGGVAMSDSHALHIVRAPADWVTTPRLKRITFGVPVTFCFWLSLPCPGQGDMPQPLSCLLALPTRLA